MALITSPGAAETKSSLFSGHNLPDESFLDSPSWTGNLGSFCWRREVVLKQPVTGFSRGTFELTPRTLTDLRAAAFS